MRPQVLFLGDSLIEFFDWQARFPDLEAINAGRAGENVQELLQRMHVYRPDRRRADPQVVVLMIGANNVVLEDYALAPTYDRIMIARAVHFPAAVPVVCGLPPFPLPWLSTDAIARVNETLRAVAKRHHGLFLDLAALFAEATDGATGRCFQADDVHLNELGYIIWSAALEKIIAAALRQTDRHRNGS